MTNEQVRVTFEPSGRNVYVLAGTGLVEAAARAGIVLQTPCGGSGTCRKCRVQVTRGAAEPVATEERAFTAVELAAGWRLACQTRVRNHAVVHVPVTSQFGGEHQIARDSSVSDPTQVAPAIRKVYVELEHPTLEDPRPDLLRLEAETGPFRVDLAMLRHVPGRLRQQDYRGTAVFSDRQLLDLEDGNTADRCFGVAVDIGTTTMVGSLLDLCTGRELVVLSRVNPQVSFGDDVLSRISHAGSCPHCLDELRQAVGGELATMVRALCDEAGVDPRFVYEAAFAGNTTMQHLLCGVDPSPLGTVPFAPAFGRGMLLSARDMEVPINPRGLSYVFPVVGGFVGGDTVAGMLATQIESLEAPVLMVDIGTNGEIVLAWNGRLLAASTAAGPAFEGARISCGMRGARGAVEAVVLNEDLHLGVIGNTAPIGICGSGLIDLVAELLRLGIVSSDGRLLAPDELPTGLPQALARRVQEDEQGGTVFVLAEPDGGALQKPLTLTQRDIRELQLGTAAIRAGVALLLRRAGLTPADLKTVLIAGGFGSFIRRDKAQAIGLLPAGIDHERIRYVGNVSLAGARWALLSVDARRTAEELARRTEHVELSMDTDFQMEFAESMIFPEPADGTGDGT